MNSTDCPNRDPKYHICNCAECHESAMATMRHAITNPSFNIDTKSKYHELPQIVVTTSSYVTDDAGYIWHIKLTTDDLGA
jgi:hypothetical protein